MSRKNRGKKKPGVTKNAFATRAEKRAIDSNAYDLRQSLSYDNLPLPGDPAWKNMQR